MAYRELYAEVLEPDCGPALGLRGASAYDAPVAAVPIEVNRTEVAGAPVFWAEGPPPFTGLLRFRVGRADETLAAAGITHLVEHLAVFAVGPAATFPAGGMVDATSTAFFASGTADEVGDFLSSVARALTQLPLERLELEKQVLLTEAASWASGMQANLMSYRFGAAGHGLVGYRELGLRRVTAEEVDAWAQQYFTHDNAAVWFTGPVPDGFSLGLPTGQRRLPPDPDPIPELELPTYVREGHGGVAVAFTGNRATALTTSLALAAEAAHARLRLEAGVSYAITATYEPLTADVAHLTLGADCLDDQADAAQDGLLGLIERLAAEGPTSEEFERAVNSRKKAILDPLAVASHLDGAASNELFGAPVLSAEELLRQVDALTERAIATAVAEILPTAIVIAPEHVAAPRGAYRPYAAWTDEPLTGRVYRARKARPWRKRGEIVAAPEGISFLPTAGDVVTVRFDECVAVLQSGRSRLTLVDRDGSWIELQRRNVRDADALFAEIEQHIPHDRFVPMDLDEEAVVDDLATEKLSRRWVVADELKRLPGLLAPGEELLNLAEANRGLKAGLLALTDRRVIFLYAGMTGRRRDVLEFPLADISSVDGRAGIFALVGSRIVLVASGTTTKFKDIVPRERAPEIVEEIRARIQRSLVTRA
jgi:predicted Zn-dependent peptidase